VQSGVEAPYSTKRKAKAHRLKTVPRESEAKANTQETKGERWVCRE